jgi:hypothetical protein
MSFSISNSVIGTENPVDQLAEPQGFATESPPQSEALAVLIIGSGRRGQRSRPRISRVFATELQYGLTTAQVAAVCDVDVGKVAASFLNKA